MIKIKQFIFNSFQENTFVLYNENNECIIIDAGAYDQHEQEELIAFIESRELKPLRLINTHGHVDHILGVQFLSRKYKLPLEIHEGDLRIVEMSANYGSMYGFDVDVPSNIDTGLVDGMAFNFGESILKLMHVPGHSPGSIAIYAPAEKFVIVGDVLFKGSIGRTDLPGGDYDILMRSIFDKLLTLDAEVVVYPGHMGETSIGYEKMSNPFILEAK
ncbi:MAG: MBL fold metallo-hydrolase [Bacteroidota bacterium]|nr:MBL fold metallo-hydrolase [Bacteroidota bacterium]